MAGPSTAAGPGGHRVDAIGEQDGLVDVVGDEDHGRAALVPDAHQLVLQGGARERVQRAERLVHQQHLRVHGQAARHRHALAHAAGQLARALARGRRQVDERHELLGEPPPRRHGPGRGSPRRRRGPRCRTRSSTAAASTAGRPRRARARARGPPDRRGRWLPASGASRPAIERHQRGLARARVADDGDELAFLHGEIDAAEHVGRPRGVT